MTTAAGLETSQSLREVARITGSKMIPPKVKIGANYFDLYVSKDKWLTVKGRRNLAGWADLYSHAIYVDPDMHPNLVKTTVLHEVLHVLFDDSGVTWPIAEEAQEETLIRLLSPRLLAFMMENTELMDWILG